MKVTKLLTLAFIALAIEAGANSKIFTLHDDNLTNDEYDIFILGKSFFRIPWVEAPSATTARDGLGPLFNANTCTSCHPRNGRGYGRKSDTKPDRSIIVKIANISNSKKDTKENYINGVTGDKIYGSQLQISGVYGVLYEGKVEVQNQIFETIYPDGKRVTLEKPVLKIKDLQYGKMENDSVFSMRFAQSLVGMGYIDRIDEKDILSFEDEFDRDNDGISGKANFVYSREFDKIMLGRFNWKASTPSLKEQIALAFHSDMGISSHLYPTLPCTKYQKECMNAPKPRHEFDITPLRLEAVNFYVSSLKLPPQQTTNKKGEEIFHNLGCALCHRPSYTLDDGTTVHPYSDFLLHDMGDGLADKRAEFLASGSEWRTQPLWGIKYAKDALKKEPRFLHDARAKSIEEAILWHGGEALKSKLDFIKLDKGSKEELLKFIKGL